MMSLGTVEAFSITVSGGPSGISARLAGDANMDAVDRLGEALADVHGQAVRTATTEVVVDLRQLEFMNSACFKKMVTWITRIEAVDAASRYRIRFLSNATIHWQRRSLQALRMFAIDLISVDA